MAYALGGSAPPKSRGSWRSHGSLGGALSSGGLGGGTLGTTGNALARGGRGDAGRRPASAGAVPHAAARGGAPSRRAAPKRAVAVEAGLNLSLAKGKELIKNKTLDKISLDEKMALFKLNLIGGKDLTQDASSAGMAAEILALGSRICRNGVIDEAELLACLDACTFAEGGFHYTAFLDWLMKLRRRGARPDVITFQELQMMVVSYQEAQAKDARSAFKSLDRDHDGRLTREEFTQADPKALRVARGKVFNQVDLNRSGVVTRHEFDRAWNHIDQGVFSSEPRSASSSAPYRSQSRPRSAPASSRKRGARSRSRAGSPEHDSLEPPECLFCGSGPEECNGEYALTSLTRGGRHVWRKALPPKQWLFYSDANHSWYINDDLEDAGFDRARSKAALPLLLPWEAGSILSAEGKTVEGETFNVGDHVQILKLGPSVDMEALVIGSSGIKVKVRMEPSGEAQTFMADELQLIYYEDELGSPMDEDLLEAALESDHDDHSWAEGEPVAGRLTNLEGQVRSLNEGGAPGGDTELGAVQRSAPLGRLTALEEEIRAMARRFGGMTDADARSVPRTTAHSAARFAGASSRSSSSSHRAPTFCGADFEVEAASDGEEGQFSPAFLAGFGTNRRSIDLEGTSGVASGGSPFSDDEYALPDGQRYEGQWSNDLREGFGVLTWPSVLQQRTGTSSRPAGEEVGTICGGKYVGSWLKGKKHGPGEILYSNGDHFEGHWVNDRVNGFGIFMCAVGSSYEGQWVDNRRHGEGTHFSAVDGSTYEGEFVGGKREGWGVLNSAGVVTLALWKEGNALTLIRQAPAAGSSHGASLAPLSPPPPPRRVARAATAPLSMWSSA